MDESGPKGIDAGPVTAWLAERVELRPPVRFTRIQGGHSNLTYRVDDDAGHAVVLRRPPLGDLLPTAHDMSREFRIISGLHPTVVPVAPPLGFCDDTSVTGAPFYVMEFVPGHVLHDAPAAEAAFGPRARRAVAEHFVDTLADLHTIDPDEVSLGELGRKEGYISRQLNRWYSQWNKSKTRDLPEVDAVHAALSSRIPDQGPARIVHGDYRLGNCLASNEGRINAVLDWEIATLGDPLADLGYVLSSWAEPGETGATSVPGFPLRAEVVERYGARSGRDLSRIDYYVAFSRWKSACIVEGVYARYLGGALDTTGVDVDGFRVSVERSAAGAAAALSRL